MPDHTSYKIKREYYIRHPIKEEAYPISNSEWNRLKDLIDNVRPHNKTYRTIASFLSGITISSFFALIGIIAQNHTPDWIIWLIILLFTLSLLLSGVFVYFDRQTIRHDTLSIDHVLKEIKRIESNYDETLYDDDYIETSTAESVQSAPTLHTSRTEMDDNKLSIGQSIHHDEYGIGTIISIHRLDGHVVADIHFADIGTRRLSI